MQNISLRTLLREPMKVKGMTRAGKAVRVIDNGKPLWILQSVENVSRNNKIDQALDEVLKAKFSKTGLSKLVTNSRR